MLIPTLAQAALDKYIRIVTLSGHSSQKVGDKTFAYKKMTANPSSSNQRVGPKEGQK